MWAQMITATLKPDQEAGLAKLIEQLTATEQPGSGLVRSSVMRDQSDPRRQELLQPARATMADIFDGPPSFQDLTIFHETTG